MAITHEPKVGKTNVFVVSHKGFIKVTVAG